MAPRRPKPEPESKNRELERMRLEERIQAVAGRLQSEVESRINKRKPLEDRWIEALEQYHGRYDTKTERNLAKAQQSKLFINLTRTKTDAMSARLMDLLFPTDDRNWGISPTPVPLLNDDAMKAVKAVREIEAKLKAAQEAQEAAQQGQEGAQAQPDPELKRLEAEADFARRKATALQEIIDEAKKRCDAMALEIEDQLKASNYHAAMRDVIEDGCKLGTGVCKGPVTGDKVRAGWKKRKAAVGSQGEEPGGFELDMHDASTVPAMRRVNVWDFFPDMDVACITDSEGEFERRLMNAKQLRELAKLPGFDKDALRRLLTRKPMRQSPDYMIRLRDITETTNTISKELFHVFEYSGPLAVEDLVDLAIAKGDMGTVDDVAEMDPLDQVNAIIWFCEGEILKVAPYPFDSGETLYSVFCLVKDEASIFGYGIPYIMADPQKSLNAGWRAMMDNAGLASGPQIVVDSQVVEPANGDWTITPRKVWMAKKGIPKDQLPLFAVKIDMHQDGLANIVAISKQFIDDMTAMPSIAQGEQGQTPQKTAFGTALLMNGANVNFRRIVKSFDDDVTAPNLTRFYDWNMQFSTKDEIKGDFGVDARGSSVLLVREMQAQNLMVIALQFGAHPVYGPMLKQRDLLRKVFQANMIPADEVLLTDDQIDAILAQAQVGNAEAEAAAAAKADELAFKREEMAMKVELANMEASTRVRVAELGHQTAMMTLAEKMNMDADKLSAMMRKSELEIASKERMFAAETAVTERIGPSGGGIF